MENFNVLLTLSELKTLYSKKPVGICPLYKGALNVPKSFESTGNPVVIPKYVALEKLNIEFSPKQAGTGDPSPDNVRPISGWNEVTVTRCRKNLADYTKAKPRNNLQTVEIIPNGVKFSGDYYFIVPIVGLPKGSTIVCAYISELAGVWSLRYSDGTYNSRTNGAGLPLTLEPNKTPDALLIYKSTPEEAVTDAIFTNIQLEFGSTPTPYEPYQGDTYDLTLPETIYGGTVDAVTGVGSKTWGYIASYNEESLPGEWISDRDVYASGATPTTGAQVAYKLTIPEPFETSKISVPSLGSENTFFTNGENLDIIYKVSSFWG